MPDDILMVKMQVRGKVYQMLALPFSVPFIYIILRMQFQGIGASFSGFLYFQAYL